MSDSEDDGNVPAGKKGEAEALATAAARLEMIFSPTAGAKPNPSTNSLERAVKARWLYAERTRRGEDFGELAGAMTDPAWDLLLDLYACQSEGEAAPIKSASLGGRVPPTTALRWIAVLEEGGWVRSLASDIDRRVRLVRLTAKADDAMGRYLDGISFPELPLPQGNPELG